MTQEKYEAELKRRIAVVFRKHPEIRDHREAFPWVTGFLGNPFSGIWFVGENPSFGTAESGAKRLNTPPTEEFQWRVSTGDLLFRDKLVKYGFKHAPAESEGGWNCYITDIIKQSEYVSKWRNRSASSINNAARIWAGVLSWELEASRPKLVVAMGRQVGKLLAHLGMVERMKFPIIRYIEHYAYIGMRPCGKLPAMHPKRIGEYDRQMADIRQEFDALSSVKRRRPKVPSGCLEISRRVQRHKGA